MVERIIDSPHAHGSKPRKAETPEGVALELLEMIYAGEYVKPSREQILSTYAECLRTVIANGRGLPARPRKRAAVLEDEVLASVERFDDEAV